MCFLVVSITLFSTSKTNSSVRIFFDDKSIKSCGRILLKCYLVVEGDKIQSVFYEKGAVLQPSRTSIQFPLYKSNHKLGSLNRKAFFENNNKFEPGLVFDESSDEESKENNPLIDNRIHSQPNSTMNSRNNQANPQISLSQRPHFASQRPVDRLQQRPSEQRREEQFDIFKNLKF